MADSKILELAHDFQIESERLSRIESYLGSFAGPYLFVAVNRILIRWQSTVRLVSETVTTNIKHGAEISSYPRSATTHLLVRFCFLFAVHDLFACV